MDILVNDPQDPSYPMFLQFCSYLRFYQYEGYAYITPTKDEEKVEKGQAVAFDLGASTTGANLAYPGPTPLKTNDDKPATNTFIGQTNITANVNGTVTNSDMQVGSTNITTGEATASANDSKSGNQSGGSGGAASSGAAPKATDIESGMATYGMQFRTKVDNHKHVIMTMSYPDITLSYEHFDQEPRDSKTILPGTDSQVRMSLDSKDFEHTLERIKSGNFQVTMRNFTQVLSALSKEESTFEGLATRQGETENIYVSQNPQVVGKELYHESDFGDSIIFPEPRTSTKPARLILKTYYRIDKTDTYRVHCETVLPVLMMKGIPPLPDTHYRELISIQHGGSNYSIGDLVWNADQDESIDYNFCYLNEEKKEIPGLENCALDDFPNKFSNRSVFSVVSSLFNQVAADPKSLPQQQLIQVQ
jgi:hypothetical protein